MTDAPEGGSGSRRNVFRTAGVGLASAGAALLLGACGTESLHDQLKRDPLDADTDAQLLGHLLDVQHLAIAAYTASTPLLPPDAARAAKQFLAQELNHADGLRGLVRAAGAKPREPLGNYDLGRPKNAGDLLRLLRTVEQVEIAAYLEAIPQLKPGRLRKAVSSYFANDAQHVSVVRFLLAEPALPAPFVTGAE